MLVALLKLEVPYGFGAVLVFALEVLLPTLTPLTPALLIIAAEPYGLYAGNGVAFVAAEAEAVAELLLLLVVVVV
jgi:hypothetical protein